MWSSQWCLINFLYYVMPQINITGDMFKSGQPLDTSNIYAVFSTTITLRKCTARHLLCVCMLCEHAHQDACECRRCACMLSPCPRCHTGRSRPPRRGRDYLEGRQWSVTTMTSAWSPGSHLGLPRNIIKGVIANKNTHA